jgi:hypothetical protein
MDILLRGENFLAFNVGLCFIKNYIYIYIYIYIYTHIYIYIYIYTFPKKA